MNAKDVKKVRIAMKIIAANKDQASCYALGSQLDGGQNLRTRYADFFGKNDDDQWFPEYEYYCDTATEKTKNIRLTMLALFMIAEQDVLNER